MTFLQYGYVLMCFGKFICIVEHFSHLHCESVEVVLIRQNILLLTLLFLCILGTSHVLRFLHVFCI